MKTSYLPVNPDYYDLFEKEKSNSDLSFVHYFEGKNELKEVSGKITKIITTDNHEEYLAFESDEKVRIDRIITINGKPGPAYDEYDSFALACLDCMGGMD